MNIAAAQSGGPTCAINASLVGVFRQALKTPDIDAVFGSVCGIEGIINDDLIDLKEIIRTNEDMELLKNIEHIKDYGDHSFFPVFGGKF